MAEVAVLAGELLATKAAKAKARAVAVGEELAELRRKEARRNQSRRRGLWPRKAKETSTAQKLRIATKHNLKHVLLLRQE